MKKGTRGWISVKNLRNELIELPPNWMITPLDDQKSLHIADVTTDETMAKYDLMTEKLTLTTEGKAALAMTV
jgi:hypothetical protein